MNFKELLVWQKAMDICRSVYRITSGFPAHEIYGMTSQMRRAGVSVAANISEGHSRNTKGEYRQFPGIAIGSLSELETLTILSRDLSLNENTNWALLLQQEEELRKMLFSIKPKLS